MGPKFSNNFDTGLKKYSGEPAEAHGGQLCRRCEPNSLGYNIFILTCPARAERLLVSNIYDAELLRRIFSLSNPDNRLQ